MIRVTVVLYIWFTILSCNKPEIERDVWGDGEPPFAEGQFSFLDLSSMENIFLDKTTENELYGLFGKKIKIRLTYKPPLPRVYNGRYIPIDRMVLYFGARGTTQEFTNGRTYKTNERLTVAFYLYKGIIKFYSVRHENVTENRLEDTSTSDSKEQFKIHYGFLWPYQNCDRKYYDKNVLTLSEKDWDTVSEVCDWEKSNFEEKLRKQGYYELLK